VTAHIQFVRVGKLKGAGIIKRAARHNLREIAREIGGYGGIDGRRVHLNQVLRGALTADGVAATAQALLDGAGIAKPRKNAVLCIEAIISLRPGSRVEQAVFFPDALAWLDAHFCCPIVSAVLHLDEEAPHLHALIVPLVDGCLRGSDLIGGKFKMLALQDSFHEAVGKPHGLISAKSKINTRVLTKEANARVFPDSETTSLSCVGFVKPLSLTKSQRMDLLTWQFSTGIQQKLARRAHRWAN
jgi:Plasmid recombination enzyme